MNEVEAAPSATVVLLRDGDGAEGVEALLLERNWRLGFYGGTWVFPGGRVEVEDALDGETLYDLAPAKRAAVRETFEETGLHIEEAALTMLSHWTTPTHFSKRFSTYFFVTKAPDEIARADGVEAISLRYLSARAAMRMHAKGALRLPPPTFVTLHELSRFDRVDEALEAIAKKEPPRILPRIVEVEGGAISLYPGDAGYASRDAELEGPRHRLVMCGLPFRYECSL